METRSHFLPKLIIVLWISCRLSGATGQPSGYDQKAKEILEAANVKGGLIVHIGCGDGKLTAALRGGDSWLVQGLDTDADTVRGAKEYIRKLGIYGPVSVERFDGKRLPYAKNLVNLLVAGASAKSLDTCTFTVDRAAAIDPAAIIWRATAELADTGEKMEHTLASMPPVGLPETGFEYLTGLAEQWL